MISESTLYIDLFEVLVISTDERIISGVTIIGQTLYSD
jgi:hypothetical protein